jgi:four helix bundle protein
VRDFKQLKVWEKAHCLTLGIYGITKSFPPDERFGLTSQLRRASASIPTNIAEGCGRNGERELLNFMGIAAGSASEVEYLLILARDLNYIAPETYKDLTEQVIEIKKNVNRIYAKDLLAIRYQ